MGALAKTTDKPNRTAEALAAAKQKRDAVAPAGRPQAVAKITPPPEPFDPFGGQPPTPFGAEAEPPPFPLDTLPPVLSKWVAGVSEQLQTPPDAAALLALAVCAGGVAKKFSIQAWPGKPEPLNLFVAVAMLPGERKSGLFSRALAPVYESHKAALDKARPTVAAMIAKRNAMEARLKKMDNDFAKQDDPMEREKILGDKVALAQELDRTPAAAIPTFLVTGDETAGSLALTLAQQGGRLMQATPEGDLFEVIAGRFSDGQEDFQVYLKAHAGDDLSSGRVQRGRTECENPALTVAAMVQPYALSKIGTAGAIGKGLLGRFLYAMPRPRVGTRVIDPPTMPAVVSDAYRDTVLGLWKDFGGVTLVLKIGDEARAVYVEFQHWLEPLLGPGRELADPCGWGAKLYGLVPRVASVCTLADAAYRGELEAVSEVPAEWMTAAVRMVRGYLIPHFRIALGMMTAAPGEAVARRLLNWTKRDASKPSFSVREAFQQLKDGNEIKTVPDLDAALKLLTDHAYISAGEDADSDRRPGRKRSKVYLINPHWERN